MHKCEVCGKEYRCEALFDNDGCSDNENGCCPSCEDGYLRSLEGDRSQEGRPQ